MGALILLLLAARPGAECEDWYWKRLDLAAPCAPKSRAPPAATNCATLPPGPQPGTTTSGAKTAAARPASTGYGNTSEFWGYADANKAIGYFRKGDFGSYGINHWINSLPSGWGGWMTQRTRSRHWPTYMLWL